MRRREFLNLCQQATGLAFGGAVLARTRAAGAVVGSGDAAALLSHGSRPQSLATPLEYFDRLITPNPVFFVRSHFGPPALRPDRPLRVHGLVDRPIEFSPADLRRFEEVSVVAVLQCAGNGRALQEPAVPGLQWQHGAMGQAEWTGVRLADLLKHVGVRPAAQHVRLRGADLPPRPSVPAFVRSIPLARALDSSTLVAYRMNGEPLSLAHGAPLRLVVPGWAGNHWMKWLVDIELHASEAEGFFSQKGYRWPRTPGRPGQPVAPAHTVPVTTFPVKSLIARPAAGQRAARGPQEIVGVAFSGDAAVDRVEVRLGASGPWQAVALEGPAGVGRWQVFRHRFTADRPGPYQATVRAIDARGHAQPERPIWNPSGYFWNAWHTVEWTVTA
jgi:DMSO/TMAO reductase YedYZ molybdopterin-dependent catalytic subunit